MPAPTVVGAGTPQTDSNGSPAAVTIPVNGSDLTIDFGYYTPCSGSIGDFVWHDQNNNGVQDSGEPGIAGVHVTLRNAATHEILGVDITDASGGYLFEGLCGGSFIVEIDPTTLPDGMVESAAFQGGSTEADSNGVNFQASVTLPDDYSSDITIDFGYHLNKPLKATKTAAGSYTRQYEWQLTKTVNPDSYSGQAGQVLGTSTWSVTATQSQSTSGFSVVGEITIENANTFPVDFSVADQLSDGTAASVTCPSTTVPANGSLTCSYLASPAGATATLNTATITSLTEGVAGATATAPVTFAETVVGDAAVTLGDTRFSYSQLTTGTSAVTFDETFSCPSDPSVYVDGLYTSTVVNTATLTGASTDLTASAQVGLRCTLPRLALQATKTAAGSYRRTVSWGLTKTVNPSSYSGQAGAFLGTSTWSVTAVKSVSLGNYQVTGSISVFNPNSYPVSFSVSDVMNDGTAASVTCPTTTAGAGATVVCSYTASPAGATATLNTATITSLTSGVPGATATAAVAFAATTVGDDTVTLGDARFSYSQSISASSAPTFPENFSCPADTGQYVNGSYSFSVVNTATLLGASTNLSASATVNVTCRSQQWATGTATGAGIQWPGTNNWFMYTPYTTAKVNLIYGQFYDAGDIYMSRTGSGSSTRTIIRITLHAGYRWASVAEVLKIQPMRNAPTTYLEPGQFQYKFTAPNISNLSGATVSFGTDGSVIVSIPGSWNYLGIHGSVQRLVN